MAVIGPGADALSRRRPVSRHGPRWSVARNRRPTRSGADLGRLDGGGRFAHRRHTASATSPGAVRASCWRSRCTTRPATASWWSTAPARSSPGSTRSRDYFIPSVSLSPDGSLVAMTRARGRFDPTLTTRIWDWQRDEIVATIDTGGPALNAVFDPTGTRIVTGGRQQGQAAVWDVRTGEQAGDADRSTDLLRRSTFSPDGSTRRHRAPRRHGSAVGCRERSPTTRAPRARRRGRLRRLQPGRVQARLGR